MLDSGRELAEAMKMAGLETVLPPRVADLFARILDTEYDAVALLNSEPRIIYVNQNYERIVGLKKEEVLYKRADELVKQGKWRRAPSLEVLATKKPCSFFQKAPSGADLLVTASPLLDETGNVVVIIDNLRDITDLNRLKEESLRYQLRSNRYERETLELRARNSYSTHIVARSPEMDKVVERAIRASLVDATVLITGESGVGKNVLARFIHEYGTRGKGPFIQVNCSAIPQSLLESELFGYEEGAFSGARRQGKVGLLEVASGGTVLLD
ncbi:MAG: sigma 54-interacting transcriptional regulator, partial [Clostridia bacterium]|nr:sigma 54-interacting transcriptional regulator [Clostridia bacterium]